MEGVFLGFTIEFWSHVLVLNMFAYFLGFISIFYAKKYDKHGKSLNKDVKNDGLDLMDKMRNITNAQINVNKNRNYYRILFVIMTIIAAYYSLYMFPLLLFGLGYNNQFILLIMVMLTIIHYGWYYFVMRRCTAFLIFNIKDEINS